jgi:endonuclease YncB( thermonuclease family)
MKQFAWLTLFVALAWAAPASAQGSASFSASAPPPNCIPAMGQLPKDWQGQAYAVSGDTMAGVGLKPHIRLWGIKAPDMAGEFNRAESVPAMRARAALEDMLASGEHHVACRMTGWDRFCHAVAQCTLNASWPTGSVAQPHDIALRLAEDGWAYGFELNSVPEWDKEAGEKVAHFESLARQARKGLWIDWLGEQPKP